MLPTHVADCCNILRGAGYSAFPVGGCVRDFLLCCRPDDWDVATNALPDAVVALFPHTYPTGLAHGTVTVMQGETAIEVTTFRREAGYSDHRHPDTVQFNASLTDDLARRDFTINAMALACDGTIIDPFGGRRDLTHGIIRCVGDPEQRFSEDALRMFRAIRFAVRLGFVIEPRTAAALTRCAPLCNHLAGERVRVEVEKTITAPGFEPLSHLPAAPLYRWAGFCALLGIPPNEILSLMKPETALRAALNAGYAAVQGGAPIDDAAWRRVLAAHGTQGALAAACMLDTAARSGDSLTRLHAVLRTDPPVRINQLALRGGHLAQLGLSGREIGMAQRRMLAAVVEDPSRNTYSTLLSLLRAEYPL